MPKLGLTGAGPGSADQVGRSTQAGPQWAPACAGQQVGLGVLEVGWAHLPFWPMWLIFSGID